MTNFDFLKKIDKNLYEIITEAEKLYAAEFFEQSMGQTRRFGEQMCKCILKDSPLYDASFDEMLATLKDKAVSIPEREFIDDLYFLKKQGNLSIHSSVVKRDGITALECLKRAFEAAINYAVFYKKGINFLIMIDNDCNAFYLTEKDLAINIVEGLENTKPYLILPFSI